MSRGGFAEESLEELCGYCGLVLIRGRLLLLAKINFCKMYVLVASVCTVPSMNLLKEGTIHGSNHGRK